MKKIGFNFTVTCKLYIYMIFLTLQHLSISKTNRDNAKNCFNMKKVKKSQINNLLERASIQPFQLQCHTCTQSNLWDILSQVL